MSDRRVTLDDLGAWLIKGNADAVDLTGRFAADPAVPTWCVRPGYRVRLMRAGQPVVFWASGSRGRAPYGVWGVGRVAAAPRPGPPGEPWTLPLDLTILDEPLRVRRELLRADGRLAGAEVFRQPQAANPSYLTVAQFAALRDHLPAPHGPARPG
ncbi:hypothetical protein RMN56_23765 [Micromonospora halotolerans]|uniref:EVE domain-containing protein n=1 Tax=Micromonospora halotolerans TaxID=709879 RepID=A0ABY9ZUS4_9ACTN|nr:hypothetical protein [Micromonospora halotolerans]WNM38136.1 hypothetical protein RMN56_23765 [Micromonospora halotolerans]